MEFSFFLGNMEGANDEHFVDGYAKTESNDYLFCPLQSGIYAPIQVVPSNYE
jgi:hypothetical protein